MDTLDEEKEKPETKGDDVLTADDDGILPPDELGEDEGGVKSGGGDLENLDSWGLETDLEE